MSFANKRSRIGGDAPAAFPVASACGGYWVKKRGLLSCAFPLQWLPLQIAVMIDAP